MRHKASVNHGLDYSRITCDRFSPRAVILETTVLRAFLFLFGGLLLRGATPEENAIQFLAKEVPEWRMANGCFSCHNNGDGARALFVAQRRGYIVAKHVLADTTDWLQKPGEWENNHGDAGVNNVRLARIQFAAALRESAEPSSLVEAAQTLLSFQAADGSWPVEAESNLGSPATYGVSLATYQARETLLKASAAKFKVAIDRADGYLARRKPESTLDAAVLVLAGHRQWLPVVLKGQGSDGGFGPYAKSPSEVFDTAISLLALAGGRGDGRAIGRGRAYLIESQQVDGGWPETTRPAGAQSYAQRISTSAWALLALLETR